MTLLTEHFEWFLCFLCTAKIKSIMLKRGLRKYMSGFIYPEYAEGLICAGCPLFLLYEAAMKLNKCNVCWLFLLVVRCLNLQLVTMSCRGR